MSIKEFNEREKRAGKKPEVKCNAGREMFNAFLAEAYHEMFPSEMEKENPIAYNEQLNSFLDEHSL